MTSREHEQPSESREQTLRQVRRLTVATGSVAIGATALIAGLAAVSTGHDTPASNAAVAIATSSTTAPRSTQTATSGEDSTDSTSGLDSSGSSGSGDSTSTSTAAPAASSATPVAVSGGS